MPFLMFTRKGKKAIGISEDPISNKHYDYAKITGVSADGLHTEKNGTFEASEALKTNARKRGIKVLEGGIFW